MTDVYLLTLTVPPTPLGPTRCSRTSGTPWKSRKSCKYFTLHEILFMPLAFASGRDVVFYFGLSLPFVTSDTTLSSV